MRKSILNYDGPVMQFLSRMADCMTVSLMCVLFCVPFITIGASLAAAHKVMCDIVDSNEKGIMKGFLKGFWSNFMHATLVWLVYVLLAALLILCLLFVTEYFTGIPVLLLYLLLGYAAFIVCGSFCYMIPLMIRYRNSLLRHITNALILTVAKLPRTIVMILLYASPFILYLVSPDAFFDTLILWAILGVGAIVYLNQRILKPVFTELEPGE